MKKKVILLLLCSLGITGFSYTLNYDNHLSKEIPTFSKVEKKSPEKIEEQEKETPKSSEESKIEQFNLSTLDKKEYSWYFAPNTPPEAEPYKEKYDLYYEGDSTKKEIYITFDCGYENGITPKILDVLKENNVNAAFFITSDYLKTSSDLVKRMVDEGHVVGNHTNKHPSMAEKAAQGREPAYKEIQELERKYEEALGKPMEKFFRPPMGKFSEASLALTKELGYKSIFWSNAYKDYDVNAQPAPEPSKALIKKRMKDGGILLLHAVSKTNSEILDDLIKEWKADGYEIKSLRDLPDYN